MLLLMLAGMGGASAEPFVEENIASNTQWNEAGSHYIVNETIYVEAGKTLTIGPNVTILFAPDAGMVVNGTLVVEGNKTHRAVFDEKEAGLGWTGLVFNKGSVVNIDYALINNTECAIDVTDCELVVTNTVITNTAKAVNAKFNDGGSLTIDGCVIDTQVGPEASIAVDISGFADGAYENVIAVDVAITNNLVESANPEGLLLISRDVKAEGNGIATVAGNILIQGNRFDQASINPDSVKIITTLYAVDNSRLILEGAVCIEDNVFEGPSSYMVYYYLDTDAKDNSTICINAPVKISANIGRDIQVIKEVYAHGNATIDATIPTCVQYNTVTGYVYVCHDVEAMEGNTTVMATGDVLIYRNSVEYDPSDGYPELIDVTVYVYAMCTGPQQVCVAVYDADVVITENEVSAYLEGPATVYGIDLYTDVYASDSYYMIGETSLEGSSATAMFGDVLVTRNMVTMYGTMYGYLYGIYVDPDVYADAYPGFQCRATSGAVTIERNEVLVSGDYGVGIYLYADYLCASAEGEGSVASALAGAQTICGNLVDMIGNGGRGIYIDASSNTYADAYDGALAEARMTSGVTVSGNDVSMNGDGNNGTFLRSYQGSWSEGGEACYERAFTIVDNCLEIMGSSSAGIYVASFACEVYYKDGDASAIGPLTIRGNDIVLIDDGAAPLAPGAPSSNALNGIVLTADSYITPDSDNGAGSLSAEVCIADNTIEGAEYGIYLYNIYRSTVFVKDNAVTDSLRGLFMASCEGIELLGNTMTGNEYGVYVSGGADHLFEGNAFIGNDCGLYLSSAEGVVVRDNLFCKNEVGLQADVRIGLVVEDCYFSLNDAGAYLTGLEGSVVGNNTFYLNIGDGLNIVDSELVIYNGKYDQNGGNGLYVEGGSVDWIIDREAIVRANNVNFEGEVVVCGKLVLDYVSDFMLVPDNDVHYGVYEGVSRLKVAEGGCLEAYNSGLRSYNYRSWFFEVYGSMMLTNCVVTNAFEIYLAPTSNVEMTTTNVEVAYNNGIHIDGCSPIIRGCSIVGADMDGIYIVDGAKPTIVGCVIVGNDRGIYAFESSLEFVVDNIIMMNEHGIYAERVSGIIHDNVMMLNGNEPFMIECDVDVKHNQFGYGRPIEMLEPLASALIQAIDELANVELALGGHGLDAPDVPFELDYLLGKLALMSLNGGVGIYAIDSCVEASGNEYGMLQTAVYLVRSDAVFSDVIRTNSFDMTYSNGTRTLSIPFTVYDGIYAVDSTLTIDGAYFQVVDDAIFLENSCAVIVDSTFEAGDFEVYLFRDSEAAVCGSLDKYAIIDTSRLYWLGELTITVVDQDSFGIAGASVVVKDAAGRIWSDGTTDKHGVFVAHAPYALETVSGVNDSLGKTLVAASYGDKATKSAEIEVDGDEQLTMKMTIKESSIFGTNPLVLGVVALVIVAVIVGAVLLARKD